MKASGGVFTLIVLAAVAPSCSSGARKMLDAGTNDAGQTSDIGQTSDVIQAPDVSPDAPADAPLAPPAGLMFPEAPEVACSGDATECPLPPSACANPSCDGGDCAGLPWVVYYENPTCVNDKCAYAKRYFECEMWTACSAGGCRFNGTLASPE